MNFIPNKHELLRVIFRERDRDRDRETERERERERNRQTDR